jgi:release factor glutamine methyltransferase
VDTTRFEPSFDADRVALLRQWHDDACDQLHAAPERRVDYLGLDLVVPAGVFGPTPMSDLLGQAVLDEVAPTDRVLDMGTGTGVNALLAASRATDVTGVDINPDAVAAATANAMRNGLTGRATFVVGDLFDAVDGRFDLVIYDPPFRWFAPRDLVEAAIADEGYASLRRFFAELPDRLNDGGRALVFFGTSGDMAYLERLASDAGFDIEVVAERTLTKLGIEVAYRTMRLTR